MNTTFFPKNNLFSIFFVASLAFSVSCRYDEDTFLKPHGQNYSHVPLATGKLGLLNYVKDTTIKVNPDGSLKLVFEQKLSPRQLNTLDDVTSLTSKTSIKLEKVRLDNVGTSLAVTFGEIVRGTVLENLIFNNIGKMIALPPLPYIQLQPKEISFETIDFVTLSDGAIHTTITNNLPVTITTYTIDFYDEETSKLIVSDVLSNLMSGETGNSSKSLKGITIPGRMKAVVGISLAGTGAATVKIDPARKADAAAGLESMEAVSGRVMIPDQIVKISNEVMFEAAKKNIELKQVILEKGILKISLDNIFEMSSDLSLNLPSAKTGNSDFSTSLRVPSRIGSAPGSVLKLIDISGYTIDLTSTKEAGKFSLPVEMQAKINSYGGFASFDLLKDNIVVNCLVQDIAIRKATGWFGNEEIIGDNSNNVLKTSMFNYLNDGTLVFDDVKFQLKLESTVGVDAMIDMDISSINGKTQKEVFLTGSKSFFVKSALDNPLRPDASNIFTLDKSNSNIAEVASNLPRTIFSRYKITANPNGHTLTNFIYNESKVQATLLMEAPLNLIIRGLTFSKELDFSIELPDQISQLKKGDVFIQVHNGFPYSAALDIQLLDENGQSVGVLNTNSFVFVSGKTGADGKVTNPGVSEIAIHITPDLFEKLKKTKKVSFKAVIDSNGNAYQVYESYDIEVKLLADLFIDY